MQPILFTVFIYFLVVLYYQNALDELKKLQKFLGQEHSDERLQEVLERCSLNNLRTEALKAKNVPLIVNETSVARIFRKGIRAVLF